jgi:3-methyl-2-oxobutanoate hydroxymethyltransferase
MYRNFDKINQNMQKERINAFKEFKKDVSEKKYPNKKHSIKIDKKELNKFKNFLKEE